MNKFEQLIEYVINDEDAKARELFHDIVVEKSRQIYEEMMEKEIEETDDSMEEAEKMEEAEEMEEGMALGGDQTDSLMNDVEVEEQGMMEEDDAEFDDTAEKDGEKMTHDMEHDHDEGDLEDRVVDLEDKLDELMAEFEAAMGNDGDGPGEEVSGDEFDNMTDVEVANDEMETEAMFNENISLKTVSTPSNPSVSSKSPVAANSGAKGAVAKPVHATGDGGNGRPAPTTKELIGKVQNTPAQGSVKLSPATKPHLAQATGVNTTSVTR
jgi:hypothetical protein